MTLYEIISSSLFLLDNDDVVAELDVLKPYYENYKNGTGYTLYDPNVVADIQVLASHTAEEYRKLEYDYKAKRIETNNKILKTLKFLCNKVFKLISTNYLRCYKKEIIKVSDGIFDLNNLTDFMSIKSLKDTNDEFCKYEIVQNKLYIDDGTYAITYNYKIDDYDYFDEINDFDKSLTYMPIVDGVLGEYYILNGFYEEADFYLTRFESQLNAVNTKTNERRIKERVWQ